MSVGTFGYRKTVKKSEHWHRHGKHKPVLDWFLARERDRIHPPREPMYDSVREAFASVRRRPK